MDISTQPKYFWAGLDLVRTQDSGLFLKFQSPNHKAALFFSIDGLPAMEPGGMDYSFTKNKDLLLDISLLGPLF